MSATDGDDLVRELQDLLAQGDLGTGRPSRESLREVRAEARRRRREQEQRARAAAEYWASQSGRPRRARVGGRTLIVGLSVAAIALAAGITYTVGGDVVRQVGSAAPDPVSPPTTVADAADPEAAVPFAGTPAESWASGASAIRIPQAAQTGAYTAAQVEDAFRRTKAYLRAAMLDKDVLLKGKLKPVLTTMHPESREWITREVRRGKFRMDSPDVARWTAVANRLHPGDWITHDDVRIRGRMRARMDGNGELQVRYVYAAAYWVRQSSGTEWLPVVVRREGRHVYDANGAGIVGPWSGIDGVTTSRSVCGSAWPHRQYLQVWPDPDTVRGSSGSAPAWDMTDPEVEPSDSACFTDTSGF